MKILEINKFYNAKRGADKHFLDVIKLLEENGHEVAAFSMQSSDNEYSKWSPYFVSEVDYDKGKLNWKKIKGALRMFYSIEAKKKINKLLDEFKPDVVHIHNIYHQLCPLILFEIKKRNIPIIMTVHDFKLINPNHSMTLDGKPYERCRDGKYYQCFLDKAVKNSYAKSFLAMLEMYWHQFLGTYRKNIDLYIAPSEFVKETLENWGIEKEKIKVLNHFVSEKPKEIENSDEKYALYIGEISKNKGADKIIEIFKEISGIKLVLAGQIKDKEIVMDNSKIDYVGFLNRTQLQNYIRKCSFVVSGSKLPETFGLVALDAISSGKPFLGFKSGGYVEIITNGKNGFLCNDEEEMKKVIGDMIRGKLSFDSEKIKAQALEEYSSEKYYQKIKKIFEEQQTLKKHQK